MAWYGRVEMNALFFLLKFTPDIMSRFPFMFENIDEILGTFMT